MQEQHLFEYAIIRLVPRVEREEFINVGVILFCASQKYLQTAYYLPEEKLNAFACELNINEIQQRLLAFTRVCEGKKEGGPIGQFAIASRFRWLTATRSTVLQTSKVHPGFCKDAGEELQKLMEKFVL
jgi:hypothetical protein